MISLSITIPMRLVSEANQRGHWSKHHKRHREQRGIARLAVQSRLCARIYPPFSVSITRVAPRRLDVDNNVSSMKHVIDGLADALQINDADERVTWTFGQEKGSVYAVKVVIEAMAISEGVGR